VEVAAAPPEVEAVEAVVADGKLFIYEKTTFIEYIPLPEAAIEKIPSIIIYRDLHSH